MLRGETASRIAAFMKGSVENSGLEESRTAFCRLRVQQHRLFADCKLFKCNFLYSRAAVHKISSKTEDGAVLQRLFVHSYSFNKKFDMSQTIRIRKHAKYKHDSR